MKGLIAGVGPLTSAIEAVAAWIGAGAVIGGFLGGIEGALSRTRSKAERNAVVGSYAGGFIGLMALVADILGQHFV